MRHASAILARLTSPETETSHTLEDEVHYWGVFHKTCHQWNAPQGVENVHTLCAGKPESDDRGNNIYIYLYSALIGPF